MSCFDGVKIIISYASIKFDLSNVKKYDVIQTVRLRGLLFSEQIVLAVITQAVLWFTFTQFCSRIICHQQPQHNRKPELSEFNFSIHSCNQNTPITTTGIYQTPPTHISLIKLIIQNVPEGKVLMGVIILMMKGSLQLKLYHDIFNIITDHQ